MRNRQVVLCAWTTCHSNRRNPGGAMSHDGSFDRLVSSRMFSVEWRKHHACLLSRNDESWRGLRNPQTSAQLFGMDPGPHTFVGPSGVGKAKSVNASSIVLRVSLLRNRHAVPLKSPATKSTS